MTDHEHWLSARTGLVPTPDPDIRYSTTSPWDETRRPTAPEPGPQVQFNARGLSAGKHLIEVHDHFRKELGQIRDLLDQVQAGTVAVGEARSALNTMAVRANNWTLGSFCQAYCLGLTQHHGLEDTGIFPHLRGADPDLGPVLDRLDEEHRTIHGLLERVDGALVRLAENPADLAAVKAAVDLLTDALTSHFAYEERELLGALARFGFFPGQV